MKYIIKSILLCLPVITAFAQVQNSIDSLSDPRGWAIHTRNSVYQILITDAKKVVPVFYGAVQQADYKRRNALWTDRIEEVPVRGGYPSKTPAVEVVYMDNDRDAELEYVKGEVIQVDGRPTLKIIQKDPGYPLEVTSYIRVLEEFDI